MTPTARLPRGLRRLFRIRLSRAHLRRELDDEIRFHLDTRVERLSAEGLSESEALRRAMDDFGDIGDLQAYCDVLHRRHVRRARVRDWLAEAAQDVRFALRQFARAPGFVATAAIMIALGVGANTAMFSVVHHLLIAPLPFADGNRMVALQVTSGKGAFAVSPSRALIDEWKRSARAVEQIVAYDARYSTLGDTAADPAATVLGVSAPPSLFDFVNSRPQLGRALERQDTLAGAAPVALISDSLWRARFDGSPAAIGRSIAIDGSLRTIVGVLPRGFAVPFEDRNVSLIIPLAYGAPGNGVDVLAKLRPGATLAQANREVAAIAAALAEREAHDGTHMEARVLRAVDELAPSYRRIVLVLFAAVGVILLIACANVAHLLLARSWARQREFAVRLALGAGRARLARQVIVESLVLALAGGALGVLLAPAVLRVVTSAQPPHSTEMNGARLEPAVLAWSLAITLATGLAFGVLPALFAGGRQVGESLKAGGRTSAGRGSSRKLRAGLIVGEVALSVTLLAASGLLVRTLAALNRADVGFTPHGLNAIALSLRGSRYTDLTARHATLDAILQRARAIPGVTSASWATMLPPDAAISTAQMQVDGREVHNTDSAGTFSLQAASPEIFATAGIPILQGRTFSPAPFTTDDKMVGGDEIVISKSLAQKLWPTASPLGARVRVGQQPWVRVVGVVPDVHPPGRDGPRYRQQFYQALGGGMRSPMLLVRSTLPSAVLEPALRAAVHAVDPSIRHPQFATADAQIAHAESMYRFLLVLLGGFAALALVLAAIGLYGVIAYAVGQRRREMGVRIALGATPRDMIGLVLREGLGLTLAGALLGAALSAVATRTMRSMLYGVQPGDPATLIAVVVILAGVGAVAAFVPARRAARVDPLEALRAE